jgi:hypothetical protein
VVRGDPARGIDPEKEVSLELVKEARDAVALLPAAAIAIYEQGEVAKFLATASADGIPNVVLIVSQTPVDPGKVAFGEFMMVKTQANLAENPRVASLALTPKLEMAGYRGDLEGWVQSGPCIDRINSIEFFRYNAYGGIHNVAVVRVREILSLPEKVSFVKVGAEFAAMRTVGRVGRSERVRGVDIPKPIRDKFDSIMSIKVLSWIGDDGYPDVVPVFGVRFRTPGELLFKVSGYNERSRNVKRGARVALNVLTLDLLTYQVKGKLACFEKHLGLEVGVVQVDEAYSCMPPLVAERLA